jgi:hypothetical protein
VTPPLRAVYHRRQREWYLWDGHDAVRDDAGEIRFFLTAQAAYEWLETERDWRSEL